MKPRHFIVLFAVCLLLSMGTAATADVVPGDVIDKSNWQKIEGMVPDSVLSWVKKGEWVLNIGKIDYNPVDYIMALDKHLMDANRGRYELREDGEIIDTTTGNISDFIEGIPFPDIDMNSPMGAAKFFANRDYSSASLGWLDLVWGLQWVNQNGLRRSTEALYFDQPMDGYSGVKNMPNPDGVRKYTLFKFTQPYDVAGTAQQTWRYKKTNKRDMLLAYAPSIRRVRRLSPSNRSDGILGSDMVNDDAWLFDGKVGDFEFKFIKKVDALLPFNGDKVLKLIPVAKGLQIDPDVEQHKYGYEVPGWQGAAWANTSIVWIKRPTYIIEAKAKDPYYNYGLQYFWIDAEAAIGPGIKVIHNRNGEYWKTMYYGCEAFSTPDKKYRGYGGAVIHIMDERNQRSTFISSYRWGKKPWILFSKGTLDKFSMAGFAEFCK